MVSQSDQYKLSTQRPLPYVACVVSYMKETGQSFTNEMWNALTPDAKSVWEQKASIAHQAKMSELSSAVETGKETEEADGITVELKAIEPPAPSNDPLPEPGAPNITPPEEYAEGRAPESDPKRKSPPLPPRNPEGKRARIGTDPTADITVTVPVNVAKTRKPAKVNSNSSSRQAPKNGSGIRIPVVLGKPVPRKRAVTALVCSHRQCGKSYTRNGQPVCRCRPEKSYVPGELNISQGTRPHNVRVDPIDFFSR